MAGNRTERIRGAVLEQYLYDECNRLLQITDGADTVKNYTYDNSGNMLSDGEMSYLYDGFGRLEQVTKADGSFQKNHYDAEGLRAEMEENGQLVKFLYNENREAAAEEESDGNVIRYIRGLGLISSDSEKAKTYYHYVSDEQGSITHVINGEDKESGELPQEDVQPQVLNHYEYDAFGNTVSCEEQVHNRFRYTGEQYDPLTGQYYLRARYYNPVIARFTQEDTYYGDGLNLYTYCQNNPVLYHDPTGHGTKENSPYSRKEQQYIDAGADPDTARLAAQCYPDAKSKQDLYNKYKKQGYSAQDAKKLANREIIHGEEATKKYIKDNNVKKSGPDYTATSPRDNVNTDWRTQERLNAQRNAGAGKGNESGNKSGLKSIDNTTITHSSVGDFTYNPKTGAVSKMKGGGHGQANIEFLEANGLEYNIVKVYDNGVRIGNIPDHKVKAKRTGTNQSWFPESWSESDIANAGAYIGNLLENVNAADGVTVFGNYNGVRVGVIRTNGRISTIFPDAASQP